MLKDLLGKCRESVFSVLPIIAIVLLLSLSVAPLGLPALTQFLLCGVLLIAGMTLFSLGSELSMSPIGEMVGARMTQLRSLPFLAGAGFVMGVVITIAEPDLQVLAEQVPAFPKAVLVWAVALGVGLFLVLALMRIVFARPLNRMLLFAYGLVLCLAIFAENDFLPVAFDSGGVTTGPITVPFILALGVGVAAVRGDANAQQDSFGLVGLCSVGPVIAVLIMGMFYDAHSGEFAADMPAAAQGFGEILPNIFSALPYYAREVFLALTPIFVVFAVFQALWLRLPFRRLSRMLAGLVYTLVGLVLFLTAVNAGFSPVGDALGRRLAALPYRWILVPIAMTIGFFIVRAEPAVHVLNQQVEEITDGLISRRAMMLSLSGGMAVSLGLTMVRVLTHISILWFILPGYVLALALSFVVPRIFTAIAFDSGGVASGPMTATFLLPFALGAVDALGGNAMAEAFGLVAMVAMTPLIAIQLMAAFYELRQRRTPDIELMPQAEENEFIDFDGGDGDAGP